MGTYVRTFITGLAIDMTNDDSKGWFVVFPFLTKASGKAIVTIARTLGLNRNPQLVSDRDLLQLILDEESAKQLLAMIERAEMNDRDSAMHYLIQEELREFLDSRKDN